MFVLVRHCDARRQEPPAYLPRRLVLLIDIAPISWRDHGRPRELAAGRDVRLDMCVYRAFVEVPVRRLPLRHLAHHDLALTPPASCRISFALYTNDDDIVRAADALRRVVRTVRPNSARRTAAKAARIGTGTPP